MVRHHHIKYGAEKKDRSAKNRAHRKLVEDAADKARAADVVRKRTENGNITAPDGSVLRKGDTVGTLTFKPATAPVTNMTLNPLSLITSMTDTTVTPPARRRTRR